MNEICYSLAVPVILSLPFSIVTQTEEGEKTVGRRTRMTRIVEDLIRLDPLHPRHPRSFFGTVMTTGPAAHT
jgi:hypothetical protein